MVHVRKFSWFFVAIVASGFSDPIQAQINVIGYSFGDLVQDTGPGGGSANDSISDVFLPNPFSVVDTTSAVVAATASVTMFDFFLATGTSRALIFK
jgi:hypothetical protein